MRKIYCERKRIYTHFTVPLFSPFVHLSVCARRHKKKKNFFSIFKMLSPKMQRSVRVNENQLIMLSDKAQHDNSMVSTTSIMYIEESIYRISYAFWYYYPKMCVWDEKKRESERMNEKWGRQAGSKARCWEICEKTKCWIYESLRFVVAVYRYISLSFLEV